MMASCERDQEVLFVVSFSVSAKMLAKFETVDSCQSELVWVSPVKLEVKALDVKLTVEVWLVAPLAGAVTEAVLT